MAPRPGRPDAASVERRRRTAIAGHRGDTAIARDALTDPDPDVRAIALGALARIGDLTAADLLTAAIDPSPIVRRRACTEAARWRRTEPSSIDPSTSMPADPRPLEPVVAAAIAALLDDTDDSVVEVAAWSIGERPPAPTATITRLCTIATTHADPLCRESAVAALGALGDPAALPAILAATEDRATVRRRAILALAPFDSPEVDAALVRALDDRDWQVRQAAEDLSAEAGD